MRHDVNQFQAGTQQILTLADRGDEAAAAAAFGGFGTWMRRVMPLSLHADACCCPALPYQAS